MNLINLTGDKLLIEQRWSCIVIQIASL